MLCIIIVIGDGDKLLSPPTCESGGQDNYRATQSFEGSNKLVDESARVKIVGMYFIQNHHLASQREVPNEEMFSRHHPKQSLIHCTNAEGGEQRSFGRGEPVPPDTGIIACQPVCGSHCRGNSHLCFLEPGVTVDKTTCLRFRGDTPEEFVYAQMHPITRRLGGKSKVDTGRFPGNQQVISSAKRGFGLSHSHWGLYDVDTRTGDRDKCLGLHFVGRKAKKIFKRQISPAHRREKADGMESMLRLGGDICIDHSSLRREKTLIGTDPVGNRGKTSQPPQSRCAIINLQRKIVADPKPLTNSVSG
ncbi:MAG: hypothetical protein DDT34_02039 [Firmicutes bacterium]|nr:hypothetical protein [Bacillota bacterium]